MVKLDIIPANTEDRSYLDRKIVEFNARQVPFTQKDEFIYIDYVIKNNEATILAGITSILYCWNCLYIDVLWVDENHRHQGYGSNLLKKVEDHAKGLGCHLIHLDTFDFQAKDFYIKHEFLIFGALENCPEGHIRYYLKKEIV